MSRMKDTLKLIDVSHERISYLGKLGQVIYVTCENQTDKSLDILLNEIYLVYNKEIAYDHESPGYNWKLTTLLPLSRRTIGKIWLDSTLLEDGLLGTYLVVNITDRTNRKQYLARYDYDLSLESDDCEIRWHETYWECRKI